MDSISAPVKNTNFMHELYRDLMIKSTADANATIKIIDGIEAIHRGETTETACFSGGPSLLPGKQPAQMLEEFTEYCSVIPASPPDLTILFELRDSLYRYLSLQ